MTMSNRLFTMLTSVALVWMAGYAQGQEEETNETDEPSVTERAEKIVDDTQEKVDEIAQRVDESEKAKEISAGVLQPIYAVAEYLASLPFT